MGYIRHHAIVVTSWGEHTSKAHAEAVRLLDMLVSPVINGWINEYQSFFVAPDGSKEGWDESDCGDTRRAEFIAWLNAQRYEDGSTPFKWALVQYGDDNGDQRLLLHDDSEEPSHE